MFDISCVIFAGGRSSRMGEDKALLPFSTFNTLTEYQFEKLSKIFKNVYISSKSSEKFEPYLQKYVVSDIASQISAPTIGFATIFQKLDDDKFFVLSVDTPFVGEAEIQKLIESDSEEYDAVIAQSLEGTKSRTHFMCGIYKRSLANEFEKMVVDDNHKLGRLLQNVKTKFVLFEKDKFFMNLNYKSEYKEALQEAKREKTSEI